MNPMNNDDEIKNNLSSSLAAQGLHIDTASLTYAAESRRHSANSSLGSVIQVNAMEEEDLAFFGNSMSPGPGRLARAQNTVAEMCVTSWVDFMMGTATLAFTLIVYVESSLSLPNSQGAGLLLTWKIFSGVCLAFLAWFTLECVLRVFSFGVAYLLILSNSIETILTVVGFSFQLILFTYLVQPGTGWPPRWLSITVNLCKLLLALCRISRIVGKISLRSVSFCCKTRKKSTATTTSLDRVLAVLKQIRRKYPLTANEASELNWATFLIASKNLYNGEAGATPDNVSFKFDGIDQDTTNWLINTYSHAATNKTMDQVQNSGCDGDLEEPREEMNTSEEVGVENVAEVGAMPLVDEPEAEVGGRIDIDQNTWDFSNSDEVMITVDTEVCPKPKRNSAGSVPLTEESGRRGYHVKSLSAVTSSRRSSLKVVGRFGGGMAWRNSTACDGLTMDDAELLWNAPIQTNKSLLAGTKCDPDTAPGHRVVRSYTTSGELEGSCDSMQLFAEHARMKAVPWDHSRLDRINEGLDEWDFDIFEANAFSCGRPLSLVGLGVFRKNRMFLHFKSLKLAKFMSWVTTIENGYNPANSYHNRIHAADVLQTTHYLMTHELLRNEISTQDIFCALVSAAIHDFQHPGTNNSFLIATGDDLALRYNDRAVLEHMHVAAAFEVMRNEKCDILKCVGNQERYSEARETVIQMVLATDMSNHFVGVERFNSDVVPYFETNSKRGRAKHVESIGSLTSNINEEIHDDDLAPIGIRRTLLKTTLHCADVSNAAKSPRLCQRWAMLVQDEFFKQGDMEKENGLKISMFMDRSKPDFHKCQIGFITIIVKPLFQSYCAFLNSLQQQVEWCLNANLKHWEQRQAEEQLANSFGGHSPSSIDGSSPKITRRKHSVFGFKKSPLNRQGTVGPIMSRGGEGESPSSSRRSSVKNDHKKGMTRRARTEHP